MLSGWRKKLRAAMPKKKTDELCDSLREMQKQFLECLSEMQRPKLRFEYEGLKVETGNDDVINTCIGNLETLDTATSELQRRDRQIAALRRELRNVGCENCAHQDCGNTEEPCKSCGIRELAWKWEGDKDEN